MFHPPFSLHFLQDFYLCLKSAFKSIVIHSYYVWLCVQNGRDEAVSAQVVTEGIYDYVENVESGSTLSTPTSSQTGDAPFASEGLGETVIHFDEVCVLY